MRVRQPLNVEVLRGQVVESVHQVMAVVADDRGLITGFHGNHDYLTYPRSVIKMIQAIVLLESGAVEKFGLDEKMIALACASHGGEKQHLVVAAQWMEKLGVREDQLRCGAAWPFHEPTKFEMIRKSLKPSPILHNCSGKHLGLISAAMALGVNPEGYHKWEHPIQQRLRRVLSEMTRFEHEKAVWGVDGCGIPTYALPLQGIAVGLAHMFSKALSESRKASVQKILDSCRMYPQLVGGSGDFATRLTEVSKGKIIGKSGAEGVYAAICPDAHSAVVVKVQDGAKRAAEVALAGVLRHLGLLSEEQILELRSFALPSVVNSRDELVGEIRLQKGSFA